MKEVRDYIPDIIKTINYLKSKKYWDMNLDDDDYEYEDREFRQDHKCYGIIIDNCFYEVDIWSDAETLNFILGNIHKASYVVESFTFDTLVGNIDEFSDSFNNSNNSNIDKYDYYLTVKEVGANTDIISEYLHRK